MRKHPLERYLVDLPMSIRDALERIEETERRTVYVVDSNRRLLGSVTDGDVRRWLLAGGGFSATLRDVLNPKPVVAHADYDRAELGAKMVEVGATCVPLLDADGRVLDMVFWEDVLLEQAGEPPLRPIAAPVVIMAGGRGDRMAPFTQVLPKPLLPVGEKTVIEFIIDEFVKHGVQQFFLTLNYKANLLRAFFQDLPRNYDVRFVEEERPLGTAGGLSLLAEHLTTPFILTNCDILIRADYHDLLAQHVEQKNLVTMVASLKKYRIPYGVCEIENGGRLHTIKEKPEFDLLVNTGMYVLSPEVLQRVPADTALDMPELMQAVRDAGERVGVYPIGEGSWLDTGEWAAYRHTLQQFENRLLQ
jgi:dTDP-glucose pyrophosphorylase